MKKRTIVKMLIDLESLAIENNYSISDCLENLQLTEYNSEEAIEHLKLACIMPYKEIIQSVLSYDNSRPKLDELEFVSNLSEKYNVKRGAVIQRIQNVRRIHKQTNLRNT